MGLGDQLVEVVSADIVFRQDDDMMGRHLPDGVHISVPEMVHLLQCGDIPVLEHLDKFNEDLSCRPGVIHCSVMVFQRDAQRLGDNVQLVF